MYKSRNKSDRKSNNYNRKGNNYKKKPYGKYSHEVNPDLNMNIFYTKSSKIDNIRLNQLAPTQATPKTMSKQTPALNTLESILRTCNDTDYLYKFIVKVIDHKLWQYPDAKQKFTSYMINSKTPQNKLYESLNMHYLKLVDSYNITNQLTELRGQNRAKSIDKHICQVKDMPLVNNYLDIGCFDGAISKAVGERFNLNAERIHGIDVKSYQHIENNSYDDITFTEYNGETIPFDDDSFELITCLMTLHHVDPIHLDTLIGEICRVLKPTGVVILREHNVELDKQPRESLALDIMHDFYDYVWKMDVDANWGELTNHVVNNYKNADSWSQLFHSHNLVTHVSPHILCDMQRNPYMSYIRSYTKL